MESSGGSAHQGLAGWLRDYRKSHGLSPQRREAIAEELYFEGGRRGPFLRRFTTLQVLSVLIATFGIAANSSPVVIGAMLIAPLMTPLLGLAAALVTGQPARQLESGLIVLVASIGSIGVAFAASAALPNGQILIEGSGELLSRTSPSLVDLLIGLAAGAAGAYVTVHREALSALPGAAIAVALIPPLAVVGAALEIGRADLAEGALLLFVANLAAIVLAACVVFLLTGIVAKRHDGRFRTRTRVGLASALAAVAIVFYPLSQVTRTTVGEAQDENAVREATEKWIGDADLAIASIAVDGDDVRVDIVGSERPPPVAELDRDVDRALGRDAVIAVPWVKSENLGAPLPDPLDLAPPGGGP